MKTRIQVRGGVVPMDDDTFSVVIEIGGFHTEEHASIFGNLLEASVKELVTHTFEHCCSSVEILSEGFKQ